MNESDIQPVLNQLKQLKRVSPNVADTSEYWINTIREKQKLWHNRAHHIVFIGLEVS
jgi:hypothetical protein